MQPESKNCQNCKKDFIIESDDFSFYEKIKVPPPTFCPECRLQRRLIWMPGIMLFKRKCDLCHNEVFSMYKKGDPYTVYCPTCWWSDDWDPMKSGMEIDFSKPFLEQWKKLFSITPILGLAIDNTTRNLSPYTNHCSYAKDCYMIYYSDKNEECMFGYQFTGSKNCLQSGTILNSENIFDSSNVFKSYNLIGATGNNRFCYDCSFIRDCEGAHHCFGAINVKNGSYIFMGQKLSEKDYLNKIKEIDLGSYKQYLYWKEKTNEYFKENISQPIWQTQSVNVSGNYVFRSKNCQECFDVTDCEDSKYLMLIKEGLVKDSYDYTDWGNNSSLIYDSVVVGESASMVKFSQHCNYNVSNIEYSKLQLGGGDCFGCVSLRKKQYCILNKQYTKEKYFELRDKIIKHMTDMPYVDYIGRSYVYGEFFPMEISPHAYNNSFANYLFPLEKNKIAKGLKWHDQYFNEYSITVDYSELPDNIKETDEKILKEIIKCSTCPRGYKIVKQELDLCKKLNIPISRQCPFCRIDEKIKVWVSNMKQIIRNCKKCGLEFKTHRSIEESPKMYCESCYKQEVY